MKKAGGKLLKMGKSIPFVGGLFEAAGEAVEGNKQEKVLPPHLYLLVFNADKTPKAVVCISH